MERLVRSGRSDRIVMKPYDKPSKVIAEEGEVLVDGPGSLAFSFTPDAAAETSHRLLFGAAEARGQQLEQEKQDKRRR